MSNEEQEFYTDGVGQIQYAAGMIRCNFISLVPEKNGKDLTAKSRVRLVMPPQGLLNMFNSMQQLIDKLLEAGVLHRANPAQGAAPAEKPAAKPAAKTAKKKK